MIFEEKYFLHYITLTDQIFHCLIAFNSRENGQYMYIAIIVLQVCGVIKFEVNFYHKPKSIFHPF